MAPRSTGPLDDREFGHDRGTKSPKIAFPPKKIWAAASRISVTCMVHTAKGGTVALPLADRSDLAEIDGQRPHHNLA